MRTLWALAVTVFGACVVGGAAHPPLFADDGILGLRIEAPLEKLFEGAKQNADMSVEGTLAEADAGRKSSPLPVTISLRGHTSRRESECTFPKLKLDFGKNRPDGGLFAGMKTLKIGTHCGEATDDRPTQRFGRIPNQRGPFREVAVYRLLQALGVPTLLARPAHITYVDGDRSLTRNAMLLEDDDDAVARLGGTDDVKPEAFTTADQMFESSDSATLAFAEALIGNFDWCVKFTARDTYRCDARLKLWNVAAIARAGGKARPLMYDFDVSGMVAGSHRWFPDVFNEAFDPSGSQRAVEVIAQLQRTRSLFSRAELDAARRRFLDRKSDAYTVVEKTEVDADGRRQIREYLDAFFREIESDEQFYRPVVTAAETLPRTAPNRSAPAACASRGAIPIGTAVSEPLATENEMVKVAVLDVLWHWGPAVKCAPIQSGTVWIDKGAISREYPRP